MRRFLTYGRHLDTVGGTLALEKRAAHLRESTFESKEDVEKFVRDVCRWGGYAGIGGRIINQNSPHSIRDSFCTACEYLNADPPSVYWAMRSMNDLKQLQQISFASKHLRFLRPDLCPVLDSVLSEWLDYPMNWGGYVRFAGDCHEVALALDARGFHVPKGQTKHQWRAADVEMAIFAQARKI